MAVSKNYHLYFNFSLPRSGGMLLQTILAQNPAIFAPGPTPFLRALDAMRAAYWSDFRGAESVTGITEEAFLSGARGYANSAFEPANRKYVIDNSDVSFLALRELITKILGPTKFVLVVRDLQQVACSWLLSREKIKTTSEPFNEERAEAQVIECFSQPRMQAGLSALLACVKNGIPDDLFVVRYEDLCFSPQATLRLLYNFLGCPELKHNLKELAPHGSQSLFFGIKASQSIRDALVFREYDIGRILGDKIADNILFKFRDFYRSFYPELLTANPAHLVTSKEVEALMRGKTKREGHKP